MALRTLLARQDWVRTGVLSARSEVSDEEAKAAQRRRYAELRWSPDTSPTLEVEVSDYTILKRPPAPGTSTVAERRPLNRF